MDRREPKNKKKRDAFSKVKQSQKKDGMQLEKDIVKKWNSTLNKPLKKNYNVKKKLGIDLEETIEEELVDDIPYIPVKKTFTEYKKDSAIVGKNSANEAKQTPNSGAFWSSKGDIKLDHALMEAKHRGTFNGRGKATISIQKDWLEKQKEEASFEGKDFWYLPFAYKNSKEIYLIKDFEHEIQMIDEMRKLTEENENLKKQLNEKK